MGDHEARPPGTEQPVSNNRHRHQQRTPADVDRWSFSGQAGPCPWSASLAASFARNMLAPVEYLSGASSELLIDTIELIYEDV